MKKFQYDFINLNNLKNKNIIDIVEYLKYNGNINKKYEIIDSVMVPRGFQKAHSGTNRVVYNFLDDTRFVAKIALDKALKKLKPREQYVLDERFIIGKTQMELANELGISQAQISRIEKNAISNIKKLIK